MQVNHYEFEQGFHKYFNAAKKEEIVVTQDGKPVFKLVPYLAVNRIQPKGKRLLGAFNKCSNVDLAAARAERMKKYESID